MVIYNIGKTAVINSAGKVLLLQRSKTDPRRPGEWDLPGGHIEDGEELIAAATREAQEEAGLRLDAQLMQLLYARTTPYAEASRSITQLLYLYKLPADQEVVLSFEHDAYKWATVDEAIEALAHLLYGDGLKYAREHGLIGNV